MGNLTGEPFQEGVTKQIDIRQRRLGKLNRSPEDLVFYNSSTAFLRLASSIDVECPVDPSGNVNPNLPIEKLPFLTPASDYIGNNLARKCVLFGGTIDISNSKDLTSEKALEAALNGTTTDPSLNFGLNLDPFSRPLIGAYGWGGIDQGYKPMPAIMSTNISYYNRGAIAKATVKIQVNSIKQLEIIDVLYCRVGYTMLLEWGNTMYFNNNNELEAFNNFSTEPLIGFFNGSATQNDIIAYIKKERETHSFNYDAMLGKVVNFKYDYKPEGYEVELTLIGMGDVIENFKINKGTGKTVDPNALSEKASTRKEQAKKALEDAKSQLNALWSDRGNKIGFKLNLDDTVNTFYNNAGQAPDIASFKAGDDSWLNSTSTLYIQKLEEVATFMQKQHWQNPSVQINGVGVGGFTDFHYKALGVTTDISQPKTDYKVADINNNPLFLGAAGDKLAAFAQQLKSAVSAVKSATANITNTDAAFDQAKVIESNAIVQNQSRCSLTQWLYDNVYRKSQAEATVAIGAYSNGFTNPVLKIPFKKHEGQSSCNFEQAYIKLGVLFSYLRNELLVYDSSKTNAAPEQKATSLSTGVPIDVGVPFFDFDLDRIKTVCMNFPNQMSGNPEICVIPFNYYDKETLKTPIDGKTKVTAVYNFNLIGVEDDNSGYIVKGNPYLGRPLDIYVNINHITNCIDSSTDAYGKTSMLPFLKSVINGINVALGGINRLSIGYDAEINSIKLIEEHNLQYEELMTGGEIATFNVYGIANAPVQQSQEQTTSPNVSNLWGSFVTDANFSIKIPPNMAAMASISAQASGNIVGENATGLSKLNKGLTDRIITFKLDPASIGLPTPGEASDPTVIFGKNLDLQSTLFKAIYIDKFLDKDSISSLVDINKDLAFYITGFAAEKEKMPPPFFLPFDLQLTMNGLSGITNYQRFAVTENILPTTYKTSVVKDDNTNQTVTQGIIDFLIKGISHNIAGNKWTTTIDSLTVISNRFSRSKGSITVTNTQTNTQ